MIFFGGNAVNAFFTRNVPGRVTYKIYNDFINEYNEFANAVSNFMNTHDIDDITESQNLQRKWNSSLEFQNTFSVAIKDFLKILNTENMITSVQNIKCYTKAKPVFEMYFLKFMSQIDSIDENDIYNDYSRQMKEKYESFVKEMYKQINTLNGNNFSDKELQKAWGLVLFQHGLKLEDKLDKFKQAYTENDYTLKNFYELFPIVDLKAMKDYAKKELFLY